MTVRFDDSLPALVKILADRFGAEVLAESVVIREGGGRLAVALHKPIPAEELEIAEQSVREALGAYARSDRVLADIQHPAAQQVLSQASGAAKINVDGFAVQLLDRRIVGADWLRPPAKSSMAIPRAVFASLKGGVGRSTALCVMAAHLSRRGRRVLAIDFDLEAPGIGTMLLRPNELPRYGTLDYLVENGISGIDDSFLNDVAADSILGSEGARVTVVPAVGKATVDNPSDALSKIARSYLEDFTNEGAMRPLSDQLREMVERFEATGAYDVVLIDARAGLHESAAAPILALGAEVLLFGSAHPQTFLGYRLLLAHLARFPVQPEDDWRDRFWFVHGKASDSEEKRAAGDDEFRALYQLIAPPTPAQYDLEEIITGEDLDIGWNSDGDSNEFLEEFETPPILHILDDMRYRDFNPAADLSLLSSGAYAATFKELLDFADSLADTQAEDS